MSLFILFFFFLCERFLGFDFLWCEVFPSVIAGLCCGTVRNLRVYYILRWYHGDLVIAWFLFNGVVGFSGFYQIVEEIRKWIVFYWSMETGFNLLMNLENLFLLTLNLLKIEKFEAWFMLATMKVVTLVYASHARGSKR